MVAHHGFVYVFISPRNMREACVEIKVKTNRLEANYSVVIHFPDAFSHAIIKPLKLQPFSHTRKQ